ncbi:MAG: hypothetical protein ACRC36_14860 [Lacrimispora sphenoides]
MKLERKALVHFLDSSFKNEPETATWFKIGIDMEELVVNLNPDVATSKNIWGESRATDNGYEPSIDADPYYANPDEPLYPKLRDIAMDRLVGDKCKTLSLEVLVDDTDATNHLAYIEEVIVKPQSYGGGTSGVNIPYNMAFNGGRKKGYVTKISFDSGNPKFTAGTIPSGS